MRFSTISPSRTRSIIAAAALLAAATFDPVGAKSSRHLELSADGQARCDRIAHRLFRELGQHPEARDLNGDHGMYRWRDRRGKTVEYRDMWSTSGPKFYHCSVRRGVR